MSQPGDSQLRHQRHERPTGKNKRWSEARQAEDGFHPSGIQEMEVADHHILRGFKLTICHAQGATRILAHMSGRQLHNHLNVNTTAATPIMAYSEEDDERTAST